MSATGPAELDARLQLAWRIAPASAAFVLGIEAASRSTRDIVDGLLFATIQAANVSLISGDPKLQVAYARIVDAPPQELRRPVSISAVANSLRMPFETARRRVQTLVRLGALEVMPKGVLISRQVLGHREFLGNVVNRHHQLQALYGVMKGLGVLPPDPVGPVPHWPDPPLRLTNRLIWEYMLRVADALGALVGDATNGVILLAMIRGNTDNFAPDRLAAWVRDPASFGEPVRNRRLADEVNFSAETLRRYVIALERQGFCARGPRGLIAVAPADVREALDRMMLENLANVQRLFGRLRQFGVLSMWDAQAAAA